MQDARLKTDNSGDRYQVETVRKSAKLRRSSELAALRGLLAQPEFRAFIWRLLSHCKVFCSVFEESSRMAYNAGQQDVGHFVIAEISEADGQSLAGLMRDAHAAAKTEELEREAARMESARRADLDESKGDL